MGNAQTNDMIIPEQKQSIDEWEKVRERLGPDRTDRLMRNGTTLDVAKQIIEAMNFKNKLPKI